jgi:hypothetical protein
MDMNLYNCLGLALGICSGKLRENWLLIASQSHMLRS